MFLIPRLSGGVGSKGFKLVWRNNYFGKFYIYSQTVLSAETCYTGCHGAMEGRERKKCLRNTDYFDSNIFI